MNKQRGGSKGVHCFNLNEVKLNLNLPQRDV